MKFLDASPSATLTLRDEEQEIIFDPYSAEGFDILSTLWFKSAVVHKINYEPFWLGMKTIQFPSDIVLVQEAVWKAQPEVIIECGVAHGGSTILYASLCELMGKGNVIGIDVEIRPHNRKAIFSHKMADRIQLIERSSIAMETIAEVRKKVRTAKSVMVILDSKHTAAHVAKEINLYQEFVTPGSYLVVMDGGLGYLSDIPNGKAQWREDNPLTAINEFLAQTDEFEPDIEISRFGPTSSPLGFLKRRD